MPYDWWSLPNPLSALWLPYSQMLGDYARELANIINALTAYVQRLSAWADVMDPLDDDEKFELTHEFIDILGTVALGLPYAIKSRFAVAAGELCHQANMAKQGPGRPDDFPAKNLYLNDIEPYCRGWRRYRAFKLKVERIAGSAFKDGTDDFRNSYNHGFSARFVFGITQSVRRSPTGPGRASYAIGGTPPLDLRDVARALAAEREHCAAAFEKFRALVAEMNAAIEASDAAERAARTDT